MKVVSHDAASKTGVRTMLCVDSPEALARALGAMRAGEPIVVRSEKDGTREVVWAPGDDD